MLTRRHDSFVGTVHVPILTNKHAYVHLPKTGGSWMTRYLCEQMEGLPVAPQHGTWKTIPYGRYFRIGTIRNPWDWYWSWHHYTIATGKRWVPDLERYGRGSTDFKEVLYGVTHAELIDPPDRIGIFYESEIPEDNPSPLSFKVSGVGLYSYLVHHFYGSQMDVLIDTANIVYGTQLLFSRPISASYQPVYHKGKYEGAPADNYDEEMIEWVRQADWRVIRMMNYKPFKGADRPMRWQF